MKCFNTYWKLYIKELKSKKVLNEWKKVGLENNYYDYLDNIENYSKNDIEDFYNFIKKQK